MSNIDEAIKALNVALQSTIREIASSSVSGSAGRSGVFAPQINNLCSAIIHLENMQAIMEEPVKVKPSTKSSKE
jgi:hypothetical protein